jgi:hypothetical protein
MDPFKFKFLDNCLPDNKFNIVVLPEPDGPKIAVIVLGSNLPEHSLSILLILFSFL